MKALVALIALAGVAHAQPQPGFDVRVPDKLDIAHGVTGQLSITIAVDRGLTISKDGPVLIDIAPDPGLYVKKRRMLRADAVDPEADVPRFVIPVRGDAAGEHVLKLRIRLWLCGGKVCRPLDLKRQTAITVSAAPAPAP